MATEPSLISLDSEQMMTALNSLTRNATFTVFLLARTDGEVEAYKEITIQYIQPYISPPEFKTQLVDQVILVVEGEIETKFIYKSPQAVDEQEEEIFMEFSGVSALPCRCADIKQNGDDTFSLEVDPSKISQDDVGDHLITVTLKDSTSDI